MRRILLMLCLLLAASSGCSKALNHLIETDPIYQRSDFQDSELLPEDERLHLDPKDSQPSSRGGII